MTIVHAPDNAALAPNRPRLPAPVGGFSPSMCALFAAVVTLALLADGSSTCGSTIGSIRTRWFASSASRPRPRPRRLASSSSRSKANLAGPAQLPWSTGNVEQRRFDALRLLRQVPAITELSQIDATGKERLRVSRLAMDVIGSNADYSQEPKFEDAVANKVYYGRSTFRRKSEPYMTLAVTGTRRDAGVSVAEVDLKLIWDVVSHIKVGERGQAYVVDGQGKLIAHPDISLVLRRTDMSNLAQVRAARESPGRVGAELSPGRSEHPGAKRTDGSCAGAQTGMASVRRTTGRGGLCAALCLFAALGPDPSWRADLRRAGRHVPGAPYDRPDPDVASRCVAHRQRRSFASHLG